MKHFLTLFILIASFTNGIGQSWKPYILNAKCIYGYERAVDNIDLISIRYDSVYVQGGTAIAYAYTRSYSEDSCLNAAHKAIRFDPFQAYPHERVYPFPIEITQTPDSIISSGYILLTNAHKGEKWGDYTFETDSMMNILGVMDSVKVYTHNHSRLVLSKNFGMVQLQGRILIGFQTDSLLLGMRLPKIETSIKLAPGDILYHRTMTDTLWNVPNDVYRLHIDTRDSITEVSIVSDTLSISVIRKEQNYFVPSLSSDHTPLTFKWYLPELNTLFQEGSPVQRYRGGFYVKRPISMFVGADTGYTVDLFQNGHYTNCRFEFIHDICSTVSFSSNTLLYANSHCGAVFGGGSQTTLIGTRIGNKVSGLITLGLKNAQSNLEELRIFPNPTSDFLNLSTREEMDYSIIDIMGNTIQEGKTGQTISVQPLPSGLYTLILSTQQTHKTFRILKK